MNVVRLALSVVVLAAASLAGSTTATTPAAAPGLAAALERALAEPGVHRSRTAALAVDVRTGQVVFRANAGLALAPASAEKLAVSFAALRLLGPGFRFRTDVLGDGELVGRVWRGDLFLVGHGDPTLAPGDLDALARDVKAWGVRRVTGRVFGDERHFDSRRSAPGWKPWFLGVESPPISALSVEEARDEGANGSAAAAARAFIAALSRRGVAVSGEASRRSGAGRDVPARDRPLGAARDDRARNEPGEQQLRLGDASEGARCERGPDAARRAAGAVVVRQALLDAGISVAGVRIADGSGLSRLDRLTAETLVAILRAGAADPAIRDAFVTSLAVAGVSGTLEKRLDRRPTRGRVIAKTGTTSVSSALAGFVRRRYVFAIIQNGSPVPYWSARRAQDRFVTVLARS